MKLSMVNVTVLDNGKPWSKRSFGFRMFEFIEFDHFYIQFTCRLDDEHRHDSPP